MIGYPTNRLLMVIDDPHRAHDAIRALAAVGLGSDRVSLLVGERGVDELRRLGGARGVVARLVRMFQFMSMDQMPDFVMYEAALRDGRAVLAVRPRGRAQLLAARDAAARSGAHFANWFGRLSTEELSRWQGTEPEIPNYLRR
jgi:hypothetical protein